MQQEAMNYAGASLGQLHAPLMRKPDITLGENIDRQIAELEKQLTALREAKERLGGLCAMRIEDITRAMQW